MQHLTAEFWENRWQQGQTGWDLGQVSPPLAAYIDQLPPEARAQSLLIPGCGNAYEAQYLLGQGFQNVTLLDIAPTAVERLRTRLDHQTPGWAERLRLVNGDFFEQHGPYDLILEQTFFCALDPALRPDYVRHMHALLRPGGRLAGVLFDRAFESGPPFGGSAAEYRALFEPYFHLKTLAPCYNSFPARAGSEVFAIVEKN